MFNPYNIVLGLLFSTIGGLGITYGWKQSAMKCLGIGVVLSIIPFFFESPWWHLVIGTILTVLLWKNRED